MAQEFNRMDDAKVGDQLLTDKENDIKYITDQIKNMTSDQIKEFTGFLLKEINLKRHVQP